MKFKSYLLEQDDLDFDVTGDDFDDNIKMAKLRELIEEYQNNLDGRVIIEDNETISLEGDLLSYHNNWQTLRKLPFRFKRVTGNFNMERCAIESLEGFPEEVGGVFSVESCPNLKSLEGGPRIVKGWYSCANNKQLTSLEGCPETVRTFYAHKCGLVNLIGAPKIVTGECCLVMNKLRSLDGCPEKVLGSIYLSYNPGKFTVEQVRAVCDVGISIDLREETDL